MGGGRIDKQIRRETDRQRAKQRQTWKNETGRDRSTERERRGAGRGDRQTERERLTAKERHRERSRLRKTGRDAQRERETDRQTDRQRK